MKHFLVSAKVDQIVTKQVSIEVTAHDEEDAILKAREALQTYPEPVAVEGINRMMTTKSHYWIPRDIEFESIREEKESA